MSILKTTLADGTVRPATREEEDAFMEILGENHPVIAEIMKERQACEAGPVRKPSDEPNRSRNRKGTRAPARE